MLNLSHLHEFQLQMLGYDISWAAFNIIEVMSCTKFTYKVSQSILRLGKINDKDKI